MYKVYFIFIYITIFSTWTDERVKLTSHHANILLAPLKALFKHTLNLNVLCANM